MAKCPKCGGELSPQENGLWTCAACGKTFSRKAAPVQDTIPADQTEAELRARLAAMEARQAETERQLAAARANNGGGSKTTEFFKNKGNILKIAIPGALLLIALIILLVCFCGLRGIYVNVENPNDYFSFGVGTFSTADGDDVIEGKWSRDGSVLTLTMEDEMFGEIELPVVFRKMSGYDMIEIDGSEYRRVSLIRIEDNMKKVNVRFDGNGGYTNGNSSYQLDLGGKIDEAPSVERTIGDYVFMGWYTSPNGWMDEDAEMFSSGIRLWEDVTYYANWRNDTDYTMTLPDVLEEETDGNEITYREGDDLLSVFMTALGWNELPEGVTGVSFVTSSGDAVDSDSAPATSVTAKLVGNYMAIDGALMYVDPSLTEFVIPDSVTSIGNSAFSGCSGLTSITIPDSVTSIGEYAFEYCTGLTSIVVEEGNPVYHSDGNCLIETESKTLVVGCNTSVIPDDGSVMSIGYYAFNGCAGLTSITIPDSVTRIGNSSFRSCYGLTSVTIGNGVTSIGKYAFDGCTGLTSVTIGNSVTSIGIDAFAGCSGLMSIVVEEGNPVYHSDGNCLIETESKTLVVGCNTSVIPDDGSVTSIEGSAFRGCTGLTSVTIPDSVTYIGGMAFDGCGGLTSVTIPDSVTSIGDYAFRGCSGLTSVIIGNGVTSIGSYAFEGCSGLTSVTIGNSVTSIGERAFSGCSGLTSITIPDSVKSIGDYAFDGCTGLTSVTIGNSVKSIGWYAFEGCSGLMSIVVEEGNPVYHSDGNCLIETESKTLVVGCKTSVIPDDGSVTSIREYAFEYCTGLTSVTIPDSVTSIGNSAFGNCTGLTSVTYEGSVEEWNAIEKDSYWNYNCPLTEVVCSDGTVQV